MKETANSVLIGIVCLLERWLKATALISTLSVLVLMSKNGQHHPGNGHVTPSPFFDIVNSVFNHAQATAWKTSTPSFISKTCICEVSLPKEHFKGIEVRKAFFFFFKATS